MQRVTYNQGLYKLRDRVEQSNLLILSDKLEALIAAVDSVVYNRIILEHYVSSHPEYLYSLEPVKIDEGSPEIIRLAAVAAEAAHVGPMASVP